jgi:hypothetical protein
MPCNMFPRGTGGGGIIMKKDPIVEEVRKFRESHARTFNYDLKRICKDLKTKEKNYRVVLLPSKPYLKATGPG